MRMRTVSEPASTRVRVSYDLTALSSGDHDTVENQIKSSFRVFEDHDHNGGDDDNGN